jgi:ZIP family zinc transporter
LVALGLGLGAVIMTIIERVLPHEHPQAGPQGAVTSRVDRVWLFVMAMAIHNFPEGLAVGVSFAGPESREGLSLATAIAIQDVPEGLAVALALRAAGLPRATAALIAVATGLFEPMGAVLGFLFASALGVAMPIAMGFAAGAMLFIVSHEVIPETQRRGNQASATWGLMAGFTLMMVLDTTL